jgi:hypothetical protein
MKTLLNYDPHRHARQLPIGLASIDVLTSPDIVTAYIRLYKRMRGDLNAHTDDSLPPLLKLWSCMKTKSTIGKILYTDSLSAALADMTRALLDLGADTECTTKYLQREKGNIGVFDFLQGALQYLQENNLNLTRGAHELHVLLQLVHLFVQYGAHTVVHRDLLYGHSADESIPDAPWCSHLPEHSFLYQVLQFGALNLAYVTRAPHFTDLCELLLNEANQYTHSEVINMVYVRLTGMHDLANCSCGQCGSFTQMLLRFHRRPKSLKQFCRSAILNNIEVLNPHKVKRLPLPPPLCAYLLYADVIST